MADDFNYSTEQYVLLGKITKARGLRGEVKVFSFSGQPENFSGYKEVILVNSAGQLSSALKIEKFRIQGKTVIVQLETVTSRDQAEKIEGMGVLIDKNLLPETAEDEFYWYQYEGKLVSDQNGRTIGKVESLFNNGAQDVMVVKSGQEEFLIPITKNIIVEESAEELIVNPPPGLLDLQNDSGD